MEGWYLDLLYRTPHCQTPMLPHFSITGIMYPYRCFYSHRYLPVHSRYWSGLCRCNPHTIHHHIRSNASSSAWTHSPLSPYIPCSNNIPPSLPNTWHHPKECLFHIHHSRHSRFHGGIPVLILSIQNHPGFQRLPGSPFRSDSRVLYHHNSIGGNHPIPRHLHHRPRKDSGLSYPGCMRSRSFRSYRPCSDHNYTIWKNPDRKACLPVPGHSQSQTFYRIMNYRQYPQMRSPHDRMHLQSYNRLYASPEWVCQSVNVSVHHHRLRNTVFQAASISCLPGP